MGKILVANIIIIIFLMSSSKMTYALSYLPVKIDTLIIEKGDTLCAVPQQIIPARNMFRLDSLNDRIYKDTMKYQYIQIDTTRSKKHISNIIVKNLFKGRINESDSSLQKVLKFNPYSGFTIDSIFIERNNIFADSDKDNLEGRLRKAGNNFHYVTRESAIRRYLLFKSGDKVIPENLIKTEALLRESRHLSKAYITLIPTEGGKVNVYIETTDTWSLNAQLLYRYTNNGRLTISDENFLGTGNRLDLNEYFNAKKREWFKAAELNYYMPNFLGQFIEVNMGGGYGKNFHSARITADKYFVTPNDWAGGVRYIRKKEERHFSIEEIFTAEDKETIGAWYGQSWNISKRWGDNLYYAFKAEHIKFYERPYTTSNYNPYFHNSNDLIGALGFYKEKFYRGNLIYGFGRTESVSYGYKAELIMGYRFGEFENLPYIGTNLSIANRIDLGYLSANISFGTFMGSGKTLKRSKLDVGLFYFTNLHNLSKDINLRQFININYATGINLLNGYNEELFFPNKNLLSSVSRSARGTTRLRVNPESIIFTPLSISGFRFAFFGFTDFGTIGYSLNPFKNNFFATAGAGVRIRNESLIFKTIQIRVVIALKGHRLFRNNLFYLNTEPALRTNRYIPMEPKFMEFTN